MTFEALVRGIGSHSKVLRSNNMFFLVIFICLYHQLSLFIHPAERWISFANVYLKAMIALPWPCCSDVPSNVGILTSRFWRWFGRGIWPPWEEWRRLEAMSLEASRVKQVLRWLQNMAQVETFVSFCHFEVKESWSMIDYLEYICVSLPSSVDLMKWFEAILSSK